MQFNIPICLTWFRVAIIPVFVLVFYSPDKVLTVDMRNVIGTVLFAVAGITDWLDGFLARRLNQTSAFGAFLDPVADKLIVAVALILLIDLNRANVLLAMIIIGREITISALREWMAEMGKRKSVAVAWLGKFKTTAQIIAILLLLWQRPIFSFISTVMLGNLLMVVAAILTLWSMVYYLKMAVKDLGDHEIAR